ncbi:hypothetical protein AVEN_172563-1 [Araneus ventricosus]|uniref:Uncharacterized protein n=1 Tax=Araneus ventricosus TaxID=182803 RepID=A0A4Y2X233_ARAVE|nr:hypothetical protein AVEN_248551-1 [Araneus ventricosus]GBO43195.1 hypothetical protein AVEN_65072-1 [Araneus ventricosus]GBO43196.1 hypothetical protein AVEN_108906-1 [Araneus ventricosus]GBO43198.1 hypothetical protein AVEN_172563-1 [Araneus ventricosus]
MIIPLDEESFSVIQEHYNNSILEQGKEFEGFKNLNEVNLEDWFQSHACEPCFQYLTDEDIVTNFVVKSNSDDISDAEDVLNEGNTIYHSAALQSVETLLDYMGPRGFDYGTLLRFENMCRYMTRDDQTAEVKTHYRFFKQ